MPNEKPEAGANHAILSSVLAALFFAPSSAVQARIINAASPSLADVRRAIASAVHGDTVILPAGTASWTSCLTITKSITIQGQTTTNSDTGMASDQTILIDNLVRVGGGQGYFHCSTSTAGQLLRITGITFSGQGGIQTIMPNGAIRFSGNPNVPVRIDHCHLTHLNHSPMITVYDGLNGVSDHNVFDDFVNQNFSHSIDGAGYGDAAWAERANYGSGNFFFMEDNYIWLSSYGGGAGGAVDSFHGGKYVFRHNHVFNSVTLGHSTGSSNPRGRGVRAMEIYNNDFHYSNTGGLDGTTSGSLIAHDNTFDGTLVTGWHLQVYRAFCSYGAPFYGADGTNVWDVNDPQLYDSGTVTSATPSTITDSTKHWSPNQWVGYSLKRTSDNAVGYITSNTSNTLNLLTWIPVNWATGNQYRIHKALTILDQPGRGKGDLLTGDPPFPVGWPHQEQEPCYSWNNVYTPTGAHLNFVLGHGSTIQEGRDFFNDTPMPGYVPYVYPHPLTTGVQPPASATPNSPHHHYKKKKENKKAKTKKRENAKKNPANEIAEPLALINRITPPISGWSPGKEEMLLGFCLPSSDLRPPSSSV
jgi:hypothetical protein